MRFSAAIIAILVATVGSASATGAGIGLAATPKGLDLVSGLIVNVINTYFSDISLPDIHLDPTISPTLGSVEVNLTNVNLDNLHIDDGRFIFSPPHTAVFQVDNFTADISMAFSYRSSESAGVADSGTLHAHPRDGVMSVPVDFEVTGGVLTATPAGPKTTFADLGIVFAGKNAWVYNLLVGKYSEQIATALDSAISNELATLVNSLNSLLAKIPPSFHAGSGDFDVNVNTSFVSATATPTVFSFENMLAFSDAKTGAACPLPRVPLPPAEPNFPAHGFQLLLNDATLGCALWELYTNGAIAFTLSGKTEPSLASVLNTTTFQDLLPPLYTAFPNDALSIDITASSSPVVTTSATDGLVLAANLDLAMSAVTTAGLKPACTLGMEVTVGLDLDVNQTTSTPPLPNIHVQMTELAANLTVVSSSIGTLSTSTLNALLSFALPAAEKAVNAKLEQFGLPLPTILGFTLQSPQVSYHPGYFSLSTNVTFASKTPDAGVPLFELF